MKAFVFPGQGAQFPGMGKDLFEASTIAKEMFHQANISGRLWKYESKARDAVIKKYGKNTDEFMDSKTYGTALLGKRLLTQGLYDKQLLHPTDFIDHALQGSSFSKPPWDSTNRNITAQRLLRNPGWKS